MVAQKLDDSLGGIAELLLLLHLRLLKDTFQLDKRNSNRTEKSEKRKQRKRIEALDSAQIGDG